MSVQVTSIEAYVEINTTEAVVNIVPIGEQGNPGEGVPIGGATGEILVKASGADYDTEWTDDIAVDSITYDTATLIEPDAIGETAWSPDERTIAVNKGGGVLQYLSQDLSYPVARNADTVTLTAGMLVMVDPTQPAQGQRLRVVRMNNNGTFPSDLFVGMVIETILANETGFVKWFGQVKKLSLSSLQPVGETWAEGDILWPNPSVAGGMSNVEPTAPALKITVAAVLRITGNQLNVLLRPNLRSKVADLHDVQLTTPTDGQVLRYDSGVWENDTLTASDVGAIPTTEKGVANGVATLGADGRVVEDGIQEAIISGISAGDAYVTNELVVIATITTSSKRIELFPITIQRPTTFNRIATYIVTGASAGSFVRLGLYKEENNGDLTLLVDTGQLPCETSANMVQGVINQTLHGVYWLCSHFEGTLAPFPQIRRFSNRQSYGKAIGTSAASGTGVHFGSRGPTAADIPLPVSITSATFASTYGSAAGEVPIVYLAKV
jgi:hypothetical protein